VQAAASTTARHPSNIHSSNAGVRVNQARSENVASHDSGANTWTCVHSKGSWKAAKTVKWSLAHHTPERFAPGFPTSPEATSSAVARRMLSTCQAPPSK